MKKREITKIIKSAAVVSLSACLLVGCGNAKSESSSDTAVEETTDAEAATESEAAENEAAEEQSDANAEALAEENSSSETTDTDTTDSSDEAEEAESDTTAEATDTASDPGEVTYVTDFTSIDDYMGSLDSEKPAIVIYNQQEGYLINMQEGQHYQLKAEDKILFNSESLIGYGFDFDIGDTYEPRFGYSVFTGDYTKISEDKKFFLKKKLEDGSIIEIGCYLAPPVEQ